MEPYNYDQNNYNQTEENDLELQSFDLPEAAGGTQMIIAHKAVKTVNDAEQTEHTEHYVFTLGNGPKNEQNASSQSAAKQEGASKSLSQQLLASFRKQFGGQKNQADNQPKTVDSDAQNMKLRCFKLSHVEGKKYNVQEYVTPQGISDVARLFGAEKNEPEVTR